MSNRFYPDWQTFAYKYRGREEKAFEDLARTLFCQEMGIMAGLFQRMNHKGNEADVIRREGKVIGFQAKFFTNGIDAGQIIRSMREAKEGNPDQTHYYIYCNKAFGNPKRGAKTQKEESIEQVAEQLGLTLVWKFDKAILDEAAAEKWIYDVFFNVDGTLENLVREEQQHTEVAFSGIKYVCPFKGNEIHVKRDSLVSCIENQQASSIFVLYGDGGSGKTAILHEFFDKYRRIFPICYRKATSLNVKNLSEVFHQGDPYSFTSFKEAYRGNERKFFIIDSAEHLDEIEDGTILPALLKGLMEDGWCILFTVRNVFLSELLNLLSCGLGGAQVGKAEVGLLGAEELKQLAREYELPLPQDSTLRDRIRNLFYLNLYTQYYEEIDPKSSESSFMKLVWDKKIRGKNNQFGYLREKEFESFVAERIRTGSFFLPQTQFTSKAFYSLVSDEIIADDPASGFFITHDIFEEWGLYRMVDKCWREAEGVQDFFSKLGDTRSIRRAFRLWLKDKLSEDLDSIHSITRAAFSSEMPGLWKDDVLCAVLLSDKVDVILGKYEKQILNNIDGFGEKVEWALRVGCQYVTGVESYKDSFVPLFAPIGKGWSYIIDLLYNHKEAVNIAMWLPLLNDWTKHDGEGETCRKAGLLALAYYSSDAYLRDVVNDGIKNYVNQIIDHSARVIADELSAVLCRNMQERKQSDPLVHFILRDSKTAVKIHYTLPSVVAVMCLYYWRYNGPADRAYLYRYGLVEDTTSFPYYPADADKTPTLSLLKANEPVAVRFIIDLMNYCVERYPNYGIKDDLEKIEVSDSKGRNNWQWHSWALWEIHCQDIVKPTPFSLQCVHTALERHLLEMSEQGKFQEVEDVMQRLLFECHSSSVSAVVASVVVAYPNEYWKEALILFRTLEFLLIDTERASLQHYGLTDYDFIKRILLEEAYRCSCGQVFKSYCLESILFRYQFDGSRILDGEQNETFIQTIYGIIDDHRKRQDETIKHEKLLLEHLSCIDRRRVTDDMFKDELGREEELDPWSRERMINQRLLKWAQAGFKGETLSNSEYTDNPTKAIHEVKALKDNYSLEWVCACLLESYHKKLKPEDLMWCKEVVEKRLEDRESEINGFDGSMACVQVLPTLIMLFPSETDRYIDILTDCLLLLSDGRNDISGSVIKLIRDHRLWEQDPVVMKRLLSRFLQRIKAEKMRPHYLEVIFGLIPSNPDKETEQIAIKYLKSIPKTFPRNSGFFSVLHNLSILFMFTENDEILKCLDCTFPIIRTNDLGDSFLMRLIFDADRANNPDRFWFIWNAFRDVICQMRGPRGDSLIRRYLLDWYWPEGTKEWHSLRKQDIGFFAYVAEHLEGSSEELEACVKILTTIGSHYQTEGMGWISTIIRQCQTLNLEDSQALLYLELVMVPYVYTNIMKIRKDPRLLEQVRTILNFMVSKSSVTGYMLRDMVS